MNRIKWTKRRVFSMMCSSVFIPFIGSIILLSSSLPAYAGGFARIWALDSTGTRIPGSSWDYTTADTALTAQSYDRYSDGTSTVLWTKAGFARVWRLDSSGVRIPGSSWDYTTADTALTAVSYQRYSDGTSTILWTKAGFARVWRLDSAGVRIPGSSWDYTTADTALLAQSYQRNNDGTAILQWTKAGFGRVWKLDSTGVRIPGSSWDYTTADTALLATSYFSAGAMGASGKMVASKKQTSASIIVKKSGTGAGTITSGAQVCDATCQTLVITYVAGAEVDITVTPSTGSTFAGWETAAGVTLENIYYANPGDTVFAKFEQQ